MIVSEVPLGQANLNLIQQVTRFLVPSNDDIFEAIADVAQAIDFEIPHTSITGTCTCAMARLGQPFLPFILLRDSLAPS